MDVIALALGALLAVACVIFAARPFLRGEDDERLVPAPTEADEDRVRLLEERDRALGALKELEFDHRTGKVSDADYAAQLPSLRREAADAIRALDRAPGAGESTAPSREADVHA